MGGKKNEGEKGEHRVERKMALPGTTGPAVILPASPGYPLLGCASAEPNSVSPGSKSLTDRSRFRLPTRGTGDKVRFGYREFPAVLEVHPRIADRTFAG